MAVLAIIDPEQPIPVLILRQLPQICNRQSPDDFA